jgi:hypothetical protein
MASRRCQPEKFYQSKKKAMKLDKFLLAISLMSITTVSAQEKGYYSIGNNAEKLKIRGGHRPSDSFFRAEKGYYSMKINSKKLIRPTGKDTGQQKQLPAVRKGYYSIGNDAMRLRKPNQ